MTGGILWKYYFVLVYFLQVPEDFDRREYMFKERI